MPELLLWIYVVNAVLIIVHEIDSAYWKEWELFKLPGQITFFLIIHIFLVFIILLGIVLLLRDNTAGLILSLILSLGGIFAFSIHTFFLRKGRKEFNTVTSKSILTTTLVTSVVQLGFSIYLLATSV